MPRLTERPVLEQGILAVFGSLTWEAHGFALATGYDENTGRYAGLAIPHEDPIPQLTDTTLLVQPDRARAQRDAERAEAASASRRRSSRPSGRQRRRNRRWRGGRSGDGSTAGGGPGSGTAPGGTPAPGGFPPPPPPAPKNTRFYGTVRLNPERFGRDLNHLYQEVIQHLAAPEGVDLEITVEIQAVNKDGYSDDDDPHRFGERPLSEVRPVRLRRPLNPQVRDDESSIDSRTDTEDHTQALRA